MVILTTLGAARKILRYIPHYTQNIETALSHDNKPSSATTILTAANLKQLHCWATALGIVPVMHVLQ